MNTLLEVKNLKVTFRLRSGPLDAIRDTSFSLHKGERLGLVGESGAGKSVAGFSIINLISQPGSISGGEIWFEGENLVKASTKKMRNIRGNRISMIFQDPMMTLNPVLTVGTQMTEVVLTHQNISRAEARKIALEKLKLVRMPTPEKRIDQYPFELSGGMRQRIVIACALMSHPSLIIADEPTTALDVTIQAEIMELLLQLCKTEKMGLLLITHDLAVVSQVTERIAVMYAGRIVELGSTTDIINSPQHPYTFGLLQALPQEKNRGKRLNQIDGSMPTLADLPTGCAFHPRCPDKTERCLKEIPQLINYGGKDQNVACHLIDEKTHG